MITININGTERSMQDASEGWVNEQINRRKRDPQPICVRVRIEKKPEVDLSLPSRDCPPGGSGRELTRRENEIYELWKKHMMRDSGFNGGHLWSFLNRAKNL